MERAVGRGQSRGPEAEAVGGTEAQFKALPAGQQSIRWAHAIRAVRPGLTETDAASVKDAWDELSTGRRDEVRKLAMAGLTKAQFDALAADERNARWAAAIRQVWPALALGDPMLIDTPPRAGTADAGNLQKLVDNANKVFDEIATGAQTTNLTQVFGATKVATARAKYRKARQRMNFLHARNKVVADRSGYNFEVNLGRAHELRADLARPGGKIDRPDDPISVVTMIHESMHAGNDDVSDKGYISIDPETFKGLETDVKLTNAAHFEVVPRRILGTDLAFAGQTFTPSGGGGPARTPREQAIRGASETFREAWTLGLNLHKLWVGLLRTPTEWNTLDLDSRFDGVDAGLKFSDVLPFWSKVMKLTVHSRGSINPSAGIPATNPVTSVDVALSEDVTRKLSLCMKGVPKKEAEATTFLNAKATAAERAAATTVPAERDLLMKLVLKEIGSITGSVGPGFPHGHAHGHRDRHVRRHPEATFAGGLRGLSPLGSHPGGVTPGISLMVAAARRWDGARSPRSATRATATREEHTMHLKRQISILAGALAATALSAAIAGAQVEPPAREAPPHRDPHRSRPAGSGSGPARSVPDRDPAQSGRQRHRRRAGPRRPHGRSGRGHHHRPRRE